MYTNYKQFYKHYGLRKLSDFVFPKALDGSEFYFPRYSILHYYTDSDNSYPSKSETILSNTNKAFVINVLEYTEHLYPARKHNVTETQLLSKYKKAYPDYKTLKFKQGIHILKTKQNILRSEPCIVNYTLTNEMYRYKDRIDTTYHRYMNVYNTMISTVVKLLEDMNNSEIQHYIALELPFMIPDKTVMFKYLLKDNTELPREFYTKFYDVDMIALYDLLRFVYWKLKDVSAYRAINTDHLKQINLLIKDHGKVLLVNLYELLKFNNEVDIESKGTRFKPLKFTKLTYFMLKMYKNIPGFKLEEIENEDNKQYVKDKYGQVVGGLGVTNNVDDKSVLELDLDKIEKVDETETDIEEEEEKDIEKVVESSTDKLLDNMEETTEILDVEENITKTIYKNINEMLESSDDVSKDVEEYLDKLKVSGAIDDKKYNKYKELITNLLNSESPYKDGTRIKDLTTYKKEEVELTEEDVKTPVTVKTINEEAQADPISKYDEKYIQKVMKKDVVNTFLSLQKAGLLVKEYKINKEEDILGEYEEHEVSYMSVNGGTYKVKIKVPTVQPDGTYKISGNTYRMRKLRADVPIKKISPVRVALSSAYGKIFIDKAPYKKNDIGFKIKKELLKLQESKIISNLVAGNEEIPDVDLPCVYEACARYIKSFVNNKYHVEFIFDYDNRIDLIDVKKYKLEDIEKDTYVVCGKDKKGNVLVMDMSNNVYVFKDNKYNLLGNFYEVNELTNIDVNGSYAFIKIYKNYIPVVFALSYYIGLDNLLKLLKVKHELHEGKKNIKEDSTSVVFKTLDKTLVIYTEDKTALMVLKGLNHYDKITKKLPYEVFNNKEQMLGFFNDIGLRLVDMTEIRTLEDLYVDPVTANTLKQMKEPTKFLGLLIRASEMLTECKFVHPNSLKYYNIKGYERIPQIIYNTLVESVKRKYNEDFFGRGRLTVDPYEVWRKVNEDSSSILVDDLNPILYLKQKEDTTAVGTFGRKKESMPIPTREMHPDDVGVISEATKDSGDAGITAYMSANPLVSNLRGFKKDVKKLDMSNILSTSGMLAPFGTTDDPKRLNFVNIQNSHVIPYINPEVYPVRTGYDAVLPYKLGPKFIGIAEEDGVVEKVFNNKLIIKYKTLGKKTYVFKNWTSKEESEVAWIHIMKPNVTEGQKVKKGDIIYYDHSFFEPDIFDPTKVMYRTHLIARTCLIEANETFEDSCSISSKLAKRAKIEYVKVRSIIIDADNEIDNLVKIGDKVNPTDALFTIRTGLLEDDGNFSQDVLDLMEGFIKSTPKAKVKGTVYDIRVFYNANEDELSDTLKELVDNINKRLKSEGKKYTAKVNSSYSVRGIPLDTGKVEIKIYIRIENNMGLGDKAIFGNQLKSTVGEVYDYLVTDEHGGEIDAMFSNRALMARVVNSAYLMGTTATLLKLLTEKAINIYYGNSEK